MMWQEKWHGTPETAYLYRLRYSLNIAESITCKKAAHLSTARSCALIAFAFLAETFAASSVYGQSEQVKLTEPLDSLCATIGRPITETEIAGFSHHVVRGFSSDYSEVIGTLSDGSTRSVRYFSDESRTAQFVNVEDRQICLTRPDTETITCGVPLVCSSGESDYVMVDDNDAPFVMIDSPQELGHQTPPLPEDHDWVTYAGGTVQMTIDNDRLAGRGTTPSRNISNRGLCQIGAGHPVLDNAFAYYWSGDSCNNAFATGEGEAIYLTQDGEVGTVKLAPGAGIKTENGRLYWNFNNQPIALAIECSTNDDTKIPTSVNEVSHIKVEIIVPDSIHVGDQLIYKKLISETGTYIEQICGTSPIPNQTEYLISHAAEPSILDLSLIWQGTGPQPKDQDYPALQRITSGNNRAQTLGPPRFARFIRQMIDSERTESVLSIIRSSDQLPNLANGMRESRVQTLVGLTGGMTTRMPWSETNPSFTDNRYRLSWTITSTDPASEFFRSRRQHHGWANIENSLPGSVNDPVSLRLTCFLPSAEARSLPPNRIVEIEATLMNYHSNEVILSCEAP